MSEFQREERYIVIKRKRIYAEGDDAGTVWERKLRAQIPLEWLVDCVVVESDWPEYETVWRMIQDRVEGRTAAQQSAPTPAVVSDGLCIWWTSPRDCALIGGEPLPHWPRYLREQYTSRLGRSGRGRLWIAEGMKTSVDPWPDTMIARIIVSESAAGIVIHSADAALIAGLPGFITDTRLNFIAAPSPAAVGDAPLDMILYCPNCGKQHIDAEESGASWRARSDERDRGPRWTNPPHRSHLCQDCGCIWRPADVATNGVESIKTEGKADTWLVKAEEIQAQPAPTPAGVLDGWPELRKWLIELASSRFSSPCFEDARQCPEWRAVDLIESLLAGMAGKLPRLKVRVYERQTHTGTAWTYERAPAGVMFKSKADAEQSAIENGFDPSRAAVGEDLNQFYCRTGMEKLMAKHWPDVVLSDKAPAPAGVPEQLRTLLLDWTLYGEGRLPGKLETLLHRSNEMLATRPINEDADAAVLNYLERRTASPEELEAARMLRRLQSGAGGPPAEMLQQVRDALAAAHEMCNYAHGKFNWAQSALDAQAIGQLNTAPGLVRKALEAIDEFLYPAKDGGGGVKNV